MIMGKKTAEGIRKLGSLIATGVLCFAASTAHAASLTVSSPQGAAGTQQTFSVTLSTGGAMVAGTQNDIAFDNTNTPVGTALSGTGTCSVTTSAACVNDSDCAAPTCTTCTSGETCVRAEGPDCTAGASLTNHEAVFSFVGTGQMRAIVVGVSPPSVSAIPDGTVLYTCKVNIASAAANGSYPLTLVANSVAFADPTGAVVTAEAGMDGSVTVGVPAGACACDCNMDGRVTGSEITRAVLILGGARQLADCTSADSNHDGRVTGGDITRGVLALGAGTACVPQ
jgi:hypothetical protein